MSNRGPIYGVPLAAFEVLFDHYNQLHSRVWKLVRKGRDFLVVGEHEPYYETVYRIIRQSEIDAGTWTGEDEANFQEKTR